MHGDVIEEVFLHAFEAGVALVQLRPHPGQVDLRDGAEVPRHVREPLEVLAQTDVLRVDRRPAGRGQALEDLTALRPYLGRDGRGVEPATETVEPFGVAGVGAEPAGDVRGP